MQFGKAVIGASVVAALAGTALAQTCTFNTGPDVIVGDITGPTNYTVTGTGATQLEALSLGTTSCNIGNAPLSWIATTSNQHPVIGGTLYKYKVVNGAGRFEQIGISWLKHGFAALQGNVCCTNCTATAGTTLGVGCSDPYTSSRNGTQSGLGPRGAVNASSGFYPTGTPSRPTGGNAGRLEVLNTDLEASSATVRYFGECQYVTPDDATTNGGANNNNNASNKEISVSGASGAWNFGFIGATNRAMSAIRQWANMESGVTLTTVDVAGDGLYIVGSKATDLGGGQWHYEYAVYNMNSYRCGGSLAIPVPAGVTVSNVGFHGVSHRYNDGEIVAPALLATQAPSSAAWATTQTGGTLTFACDPYTTSIHANAIRWGTMYNFRFDANVPPAAAGGSVTVGLWRAGTPGDFTAAAAVPSCGTGPGFSGQPSASTVCPGDSASFTATATGTSPAHKWQRETSPGVYSNLTDGAVAGLGTVAGSATGTLSITGIEAGASVNVRDTATNGCGTTNSDPASLVVRSATDPLCGGLVCDPVDFNGDGLMPDTSDIDDFLSVFSGGTCSTGTCGDIDFNNDGLFPDTGDIDGLLSVFSGGPCM
ncbi:MAG: hypothetical protein U0637_02745 [Phycisphaerales bacterium]